jgi:hypothetical protein
MLNPGLTTFHSHVATHERAMQESRGRPGIAPLDSLTNELVWATSALKHATTWQHIDDEGFGTVVTNKVGSKYWVMARQRRDATSPRGDMASIFGFNEGPLYSGSDIYEHEGVLLEPGTVL